MKKLKILVAILSLISLVNPVVVHAVDEETATQNPKIPSEITSEDVDAAKKRIERLQKYKDQATVKISANEEKRIAGACKSAQQITDKLSSDLTAVAERRSKAYTTVSDKISSLITRLEAVEVDAAELQASLTEFDSQVAALLESISEYKLTVEDISLMDCESDPAGFKAAIKSAKEQRVELVNSSQAIRSYISTIIKPIIQNIKESLST